MVSPSLYEVHGAGFLKMVGFLSSKIEPLISEER